MTCVSKLDESAESGVGTDCANTQALTMPTLIFENCPQFLWKRVPTGKGAACYAVAVNTIWTFDSSRFRHFKGGIGVMDSMRRFYR